MIQNSMCHRNKLYQSPRYRGSCSNPTTERRLRTAHGEDVVKEQDHGQRWVNAACALATLASLWATTDLSAQASDQDPSSSDTPMDPTASGQAVESGDAAPTQSGASEAAPESLLPLPDYSGDLWERGFILGDWGGVRTSLGERGIQLDIDWIQHLQSVVSGGRRTSTEYGGSLDYLL